jgi:hypothetical protein
MEAKESQTTSKDPIVVARAVNKPGISIKKFPESFESIKLISGRIKNPDRLLGRNPDPVLIVFRDMAN